MALDMLRKIGLSDGERKVYAVLLDLGTAPLNQIHEKVGIERRNIYDILNKLIERGLVTYITENKRRSFKLAHPNKLLGYIDEKKGELERVREEVQGEMPELIKKFSFASPKINAEIYRGVEGVKAVWDDMLNYKELRWIGSGFYVPDKYPAFFKSWDRRRAERKIKSMHLFRDEKRNHPALKLFPYAKFLPQEFSGNPTVTVVYGNKVVQFLYGGNFFAFVIESAELAENYKRYHKYLWENVAKA